MKNIIVTDQEPLWQFLGDQAEVLSAADYLSQQDILSQKPIRIINLCQKYDYQSQGYYVSLLAEARGHKIFPSVMAIQDVKGETSRAVADATIHDDIQIALKSIKSDEFVLSVYFGKNIAKKYNAISAKFHGLFPIPLFEITFVRKKEWVTQKIRILSIGDVPSAHKAFFIESAKDYFSRKRFYFARIKNYRYDLAILVNDKDKTAPSDKEAVERFVEAGEKIGLNVQIVRKENIRSLSDYDAIFIRETTSIMNSTYKLSRKAQAEGMVVVDDPVSMLRCTNKVYLAELLKKNKIQIPETSILIRKLQSIQIPKIQYPCVLKRPDGCSSQGLVKVNDQDELRHHANHYFKDSDLILAQNFMPTDFDWRIGIFDNKPIFACQYYMVKDHWKIMLWGDEKNEEGSVVTVDPDKVPPAVMQAALQSTALIGNGLYGVDLKQIGNEVYVIEINDNPSIDHGLEDEFLGDQLYTDVMQVFLQRLNQRYLDVH